MDAQRFRSTSSLLAVLCLCALAAASSAFARGAGGTVTSTKPAKQPPYYRGDLPASAPPAARLPVTLAPLPPGTPESWLPVAALERLAADMNEWLERTQAPPLLAIEPGSGKSVPPAVYLGCSLDELTDECSEEEPLNVLAVTGATREWRREAALAAGRSGVGRILVLNLEIAPHWIRQRGLKGAKEVRLGTGYVQPLPWLTSLDTPVWVLQVTGAVVDAEGEVVRSGAEGIWALRTPFRASVLRAQRLLTDEDVEFVRADLRRPDLSGEPRAWEAALRHLVVGLLGSADSPAGLEAR